MKQEAIVVTLDAQNRVSMGKLSKKLAKKYKVYVEDGKFIFEPVAEHVEKSKSEELHWLLKPENKNLLEEFKEGLSQKATISHEELKKKLKSLKK